jgi:hypothetical protein
VVLVGRGRWLRSLALRRAEIKVCGREVLSRRSELKRETEIGGVGKIT